MVKTGVIEVNVDRGGCDKEDVTVVHVDVGRDEVGPPAPSINEVGEAPIGLNVLDALEDVKGFGTGASELDEDEEGGVDDDGWIVGGIRGV